MTNENDNLTRNLDIAEKMMQQFRFGGDEVDTATPGNNAASTSPELTNSTFFCQDRRAPGCEMKSLQKQMDYDQKRLLATRAIQNKPTAGEPRTPTPSWVGLGFSNSMPENVIREKVCEDHTIRVRHTNYYKCDKSLNC